MLIFELEVVAVYQQVNEFVQGDFELNILDIFFIIVKCLYKFKINYLRDSLYKG